MQGASFAPLSGHQGAIREFCTAAKALRDASEASPATAKTARERKKQHKEQLMEALDA